MNGDVLTDLNFKNFYQSHVELNNIFTISSYNRTQLNDYGVLEIDKNRKLHDFKEKPVTNFEVSMGVYVANKKILDVIPDDTFYGFDHLMLDLIKLKNPAFVITHNGYWLDIGRPDDYMQAIEEFEQLKSKFLHE